MNIVRWDPFRTFAGLTVRSVPALFNDADASTAWAPPIDVVEKEDLLVIRAEVPGVKREDLEVQVDNGQLTLSGSRDREAGRVHGSFSRRFRLSDAFDAQSVEATYENGVLEITIPRTEKSKSRKVEIKVA